MVEWKQIVCFFWRKAHICWWSEYRLVLFLSSETLTFLVDSPNVGRLVGKKGATVASLREKSNCMIKIDDHSLPNSTESLVILRAYPQQLGRGIDAGLFSLVGLSLLLSCCISLCSYCTSVAFLLLAPPLYLLYSYSSQFSFFLFFSFVQLLIY